MFDHGMGGIRFQLLGFRVPRLVMGFSLGFRGFCRFSRFQGLGYGSLGLRAFCCFCCRVWVFKFLRFAYFAVEFKYGPLNPKP